MSIETTTHLNFRGTARPALEFYQSVLDGHLVVATYGDFGMPKEAPGADKVVFGQVENADGFRIMAYDIPGHDDTTGDDITDNDDITNNDSDATVTAGSTHRVNGTTVTDRTFFQSLRGDTLAEVERYWHALSEGATIVEDLAASAWSPGFGMLTDMFGVTWVLDVRTAYAG